MEDENRITTLGVNMAFIKPKRGILKVAEMVSHFTHLQKIERLLVSNRSPDRANMCPVHIKGQQIQEVITK